jgi:medium-chain acyl-[acyl-carrier-protein] hydrolase
MTLENGDSRNGPWLAPSRNPAAKVQLFFLPHAGAGTAVYHSWKRLLPADIDLCLVQIPGRESRLGEASYTDAEALIEEIALAMASRLNKPYAIFGHSMGALLALDLAFRLREHGQPDPLYLFVSGRNATHIPLSVRHGAINKLSDEEFLEALAVKYGGLPREILETPELLEVYLPILRADLILLERHRFERRPPLNCPIAAFAGRRDDNVSPEGLAAWREHTSGRFESRLFDGTHFYLHGDNRSELVDLVAARLKEASTDISLATRTSGTDAR